MQLRLLIDIGHKTLFSKMIKRNVPLVIVRIIAVWYQTQPMCVKWGKVNSAYLSGSNRVRQGGVLSPTLFAIMTMTMFLFYIFILRKDLYFINKLGNVMY